MAPKKDRSAHKKVHYSSHIQVYNVDNSTASPSVLLFFDNKRYLFNAGEGIQRHFIEHKQKMNKITAVLATRVTTDVLAGLPGMLLSQVSVGSDGTEADAVKGSLYGPQGLSRYCDAFRNYAGSFKLVVNEIAGSSTNPVLQDDFVTITPVAVTPNSSHQAAAAGANGAATAAAAAAVDSGEAVDPADTAVAAENGEASAEEPAAKRQRIDSITAAAAAVEAETAGADFVLGRGMSAAAPVALCYVCQLSNIPGRFDPQKAAQLGVPKGPMYGELQRGQSVTLPNGDTVHPADVMDSPVQGACLLLVDCPTLAYLPSIQASPLLLQLQQQAKQQQQPQGTAADGSAAANGSSSHTGGSSASISSKKFIVLHLGPAEVTSSKAYEDWLLGFGAGAEHLLVSSDSQLSTTTGRAAVLQAQLNVIEPQVFSLQGFQCLQQQQQLQQEDGGANTVVAAGANGLRVLHAGNGCRYTLAPFRHQGLGLADVSAAPDLAAVQASVRDGKPLVVELLQQYNAAKAEVQQQPLPQQLEGIGRRSCELTLLGTCSACPSNHRNVSAYYLDLFDRGGLLMDCGEDTMGQLERRFGREDASRRILQLHAVWVSHMHADHHGGLYPLLLQRQHLQQQQAAAAAAAAAAGGAEPAAAAAEPAPILILGPWPLFRVLREYSKVLDLQFRFLPNTYFYNPGPYPPPAVAVQAYEDVKAASGLNVLQPFPVQHVSHSTGLLLESKDGWKVVFSGDTRPCQSVIDAAKDATLLVHEATFENELQEDAIAKKHSTTAEALDVATKAGAYRTVLTHFSTRYPKIPVLKPPQTAASGEEAAADGDANSSTDLAAVGSVVVGFDLMSINLADLPWMPKMLPVLDELFKEEEQTYQQDDEA